MFKDLSEDDKNRIAHVVTGILTDAAKPKMQAFRKRLQASSAVAKAEVQSRLDQCYKGATNLPAEAVFLFYEPMPLTAGKPEGKEKKVEAKPADTGYDSGFLFIFSLPPVDGKRHTYLERFSCCYPVWEVQERACTAE